MADQPPTTPDEDREARRARILAMTAEDRASLAGIMRRKLTEIPAAMAKLQDEQQRLTGWLAEFAPVEDEGGEPASPTDQQNLAATQLRAAGWNVFAPGELYLQRIEHEGLRLRVIPVALHDVLCSVRVASPQGTTPEVLHCHFCGFCYPRMAGGAR